MVRPRQFDAEGQRARRWDAVRLCRICTAMPTIRTDDRSSTVKGPVTPGDPEMEDTPSSIELYWIPLGAGGRFVRINGRAFEAITALVEHRARSDLYHSALAVTIPGCRFVIEQTPVLPSGDPERGVVVQGPVGARWAGRFRLFRYEIRRWPNGIIPDAQFAVASPVRVSNDGGSARRLLDLVPLVPALVWGRDEMRCGEMWNSNSVVSWLLERSGVDVVRIQPPTGGRAPGWRAGIVAARRPSTRWSSLHELSTFAQPPTIISTTATVPAGASRS